MSRCAAVTSGPISRARRRSPGPTCSSAHPLARSCATSSSPTGSTATTHGDRHAALARRAEARPTRRRRRPGRGRRRAARPCGSWRRRAPAPACRARCRSRRRTGRSAWSRRSDTASTSGCVQQRVDRLLVAVHDVEHAVGQAGLGATARRAAATRDGSFSRRLEHERVAARDGDREHPHRHHRREVERRDARDHAERLADRVGVDAGGDVLGVPALEQVRDAAGELDDLQAARPPRRARRECTLPCSAVISAASSSRCASTSSRNANSTVGALGQRGVAASPGSARAAAATAASTSAGAAKSTCPLTSPVAGS